MSLPNYLQKLKSAGIYRFVFDKSEIPGADAETLRLVVGYSEKGPFNTPVYIESPSDFKVIYGDVSKKLERNGVYFHRMALQALKAGPILALNLKYFDESNETGEKVQAYSFNVNGEIGNAIDLLVRQIYTTTRFWTLEPEHLESIESLTNYIDIAATDSKETSCTIFMRGYQPSGYDVTLSNWYSSVLNGKELPEFMENYAGTLVSQYFAEIYVFRGEFTPAIATSEALAKYFNVVNGNVTLKPYITNAFGEQIDTLQALAENEASNFINNYAGILLPDFQSANGSIISLDQLFNADYDTHKMMMRLNQDFIYDGTVTLNQLDTTGWLNGLKDDYSGSNAVNMMSAHNIIPTVSTFTYSDNTWTLTNPLANPNYFEYVFSDFDLSADGRTLVTTDNLDGVVLMQGERFLGANNKVSIATSLTTDQYYTVNDEGHYDVEPTVAHIDAVPEYWTVEGIEGQFETEEAAQAAATAAGISATPEHHDAVPEYWTVNGEGHYNAEPDVEFVNTTTFVFDNPIYTTTTNIYKCNSSTSATCNNCEMTPTYVQGYTRSAAYVKPTASTQLARLNWINNAILAAITNYDGLRIGLTGNIDVEYHYIVDTFDSYVESECKSILSNLARQKDNAILIANFPKMKTFEQCPYTSFTDSKNNFNTAYIAQGGNKQKPMGVVFGLPTEENGASWSAFYTQVIIRDPSTGIKYTCPSAALISNCYMDKYQNRRPYSVVAGPDFSRLTENGLIGPDFNFCREDLNNLEPFGVNCIVFAPRKGVYSNGNQSAKQNPVTTLSSINVREVVIFVQDEVESILQSYQWWTNNAELRSKIKAKVDYLLGNVQSNGGVYDFNTVCDSSNNTDEVIDNGMFIIDINIEPARGAGIMVQRLTLYRKGGISSLALQQ